MRTCDGEVRNRTELIGNSLLEHLIIMGARIPEHHVQIVVPFSGGKDSQSCLKLACAQYTPDTVIALFCDTGFEHPITYRHVKSVCEDYKVSLITLTAGTVESVCTKYKRLPGGGARHCTDELKIRPSKFFYKYLTKHIGGFEVWYGMRSDESAAREKRYRGKTNDSVYAPHEVLKKYPKYLHKMGVSFRLPVLDFSKTEVLELLEGEQNALYNLGFDRVGCFPCLASGEAWQVLAFNHDDVGLKHFKIAEKLATLAGRPLLVTSKYKGQGPGCALCSI